MGKILIKVALICKVRWHANAGQSQISVPICSKNTWLLRAMYSPLRGRMTVYTVRILYQIQRQSRFTMAMTDAAKASFDRHATV